MNHQLSNPAAAITTAKTADFISSNGKGILLTLGIVGGLYYLPKWYKKNRAERFARQNIGHPDVTAAAIIYESFTRIGYRSGLLSLILPEFDIAADEAALYDIASRVTNIQSVANAYYILWDRNLLVDTKNGLSTAELQAFFDLINAPNHNPMSIDEHYYIDDKLYCAKKAGIRVPTVEKQADGSWSTTDKLYGNYEHNQYIGRVVTFGIHAPENKRYYIVKWCAWITSWCYYGIVWQDQVTNIDRTA